MTLVVGYIPRWFTCPQTVTYPSSNRLTATRPGVESNVQSVDRKSDTYRLYTVTPRGVAMGEGGISRYIPPRPNQSTLNFFMWLFCLLDPGQIRYRAIYTHPNQIPGYAFGYATKSPKRYGSASCSLYCGKKVSLQRVIVSLQLSRNNNVIAVLFSVVVYQAWNDWTLWKDFQL